MQAPIIPIKRASEETINALINAGYLYVDEKGIHVSEETNRNKE